MIASSGVTELTADAALVRAGASTAGAKPGAGADEPAFLALVEEATPRPLSIFIDATLQLGMLLPGS